MCRIDEPFGRHSLEEKTDLAERFSQALDEYCAEGSFRNLLEKHFLLSWPQELGTIERVEIALKCARQTPDLPGKITSFVQAIKERDGGYRLQVDNPDPVYQGTTQKRFPDCFAFAKDVATEVFTDSLYGFHQCFKGTMSVHFGMFVHVYASTYYGESCHLTNLLFQDSKINSLSREKREELLWNVFRHHLIEWDDLFEENLMNVVAWDVYSAVPTSDTLQFSRAFENAFEYLTAWTKADAQSREHSEALGLLGEALSVIDSWRIKVSSRKEGPSEGSWTKNDLRALKCWLDDKCHKISSTWCCSVKLEDMSPEAVDDWERRAHEAFLPLQPNLDKERAGILIACSIKRNLKKWTTPGQITGSILGDNSDSDLWYLSTFREVWRDQLLLHIEDLSYEDRLHVLGRYFGFGLDIHKESLPQFITLQPQNLETDESHGSAYERYDFLVEQGDRDWWSSLLRTLPEDESFPKELLPLWTVIARTRLELGEAAVPFADNSIGILRGQLKENDSKVNTELLKELLEILKLYAPEKALRHLLLLLRTSPQPCTTENLDIDRGSICPQSMSEITKELYGKYFQGRPNDIHCSREERDSEEVEFLRLVRAWFAQYCLGRLRLRKGQKAGSERYENKQAVEPSPIWRQGYLKALIELGVDLQGKVHKAVYFTRKFDPDEGARSVAKDCYKAVRREQKKSQTAADIRRGLTAAYWWLLLAQRQTLGADINYEEARLTRRRLLRRP